MPNETESPLQILEYLVSTQPEYMVKRIRYIVHDQAIAEDLAQETLLRAVRGLSRFRGGAETHQLCPWMERIAHNLTYNYLRDGSRRPAFDSLEQEYGEAALQLSASDADPALLSSRAETRAHLLSAIRALPPEAYAVFYLRAIEGRSTAATAHALGISTDLVKWRLRRAREILHRRLLASDSSTSLL
jgi:RNA polymerase sigma-70 factor (ECF subfamily)